MSSLISDQKRWQMILRRQSLANAERWLLLLEDSPDPISLVANDYDNVLRALEVTLQEPETFDLSYRLVQTLYPIVFGYADWDRWLVYLERVLTRSQESGRQVEAARLLVQMGDLLYHMGDLQQSEMLYQKGLATHKQLDDQASYSSVLAKLAFIYDLQSKTAEGIDLCLQALSIARAIGDEQVMAHSYLNLSHIYRRARELEPGLEAARQAYVIYSKLEKLQLATRALLNLVSIWAAMGAWEEVNTISQELMTALVTAGDIKTLSQLKNNLGIVAFEQANYVAAEAAWQEALRLHSQIQEPTEQAGLYNNLGMVYTRMGEWEAAQEMLERAVFAYQQLGDIYNWANSLDNLADLYAAQQDVPACRGVLVKAIAGLRTMADSPHAETLLAQMTEKLRSPDGRG